ncbi:MAG: hypothetical protein HZY79_05380 [Rhodoblastus sp.]|nr:MAG: hypothetical protein HZY79_05380 [Rhodoblastus sp.]
MVLAFALATTATPANAETTDVEQLKLRPENFVGKAITVEGILFGATRTRGFIHYKAGRLNDEMLTIDWSDHGTAWERAQYECANEIDDKCKVIVTGVWRARPYQADTFFVEKPNVEFVAPK